jgi:molecular chaperone DnaK (HSP70)
MTTFGIDLGTTYSCIAYVDSSGRPAIIKNPLTNEDTTPSVVWFESADNVVVGRDAKNAAKLFSGQVVSLIKRNMGEKLELSYHGRNYTPESISALILKDLAKSAEQATGEPVKDVVITVPAYFGAAEREATRNAGRIAGLNVLRVVEEPVAAALHYDAVTTGADRTILVFDLGGGTFDTTVISLRGNEITVICTDGDHHLGGADWDDKIVAYLLDEFLAANPGSEAGDDDEFMQDLTNAAEDLKKSLTTAQKRPYGMRFDGATARPELTREKLQEITADLLGQVQSITARTLATAKEKGIDRYDEVLLVGGSTKAPAVGEMLRREFGFAPKLHEPDLAVAKGAALYALIESVKVLLPDGADGAAAATATVSEEAATEVADRLGISADQVRKLASKKVTTVAPRAFGIKVLDSVIESNDTFKIHHLIDANRKLPAGPLKGTFQTASVDQTMISIEVWEQAGSKRSPDPADNRKIGDGLISDLPPLPKGSPVDVTFWMSDSGVLRVEALEPKTGRKLNIELQIAGLTEQEVVQATDLVAKVEVGE